MVIKNGQSRGTGNIGHTSRRKTKQKHNTLCVGHHHIYSVYYVQGDKSVLNYNAVRLVMCEGWQLIHMGKTLV
jgi:hypothetical protein